MAKDLILETLKSIRDEGRKTNVELKKLREDSNSEFKKLRDEIGSVREEVHVGLGNVRDELGRRIVESEMRTATAITQLAGTVGELTTVLKASHDLRPRLERCERDIEQLKSRLPDA